MDVNDVQMTVSCHVQCSLVVADLLADDPEQHIDDVHEKRVAVDGQHPAGRPRIGFHLLADQILVVFLNGKVGEAEQDGNAERAARKRRSFGDVGPGQHFRVGHHGRVEFALQFTVTPGIQRSDRTSLKSIHVNQEILIGSIEGGELNL